MEEDAKWGARYGEEGRDSERLMESPKGWGAEI